MRGAANPARPRPPCLRSSSAPAMPPAAAVPRSRALTLVTWDIDGTLLRATGDRANALHRAAFTAAWEAVLGQGLDVGAIPHQGSTDPLILIKGALHAGLAASAADLMGGPPPPGGSPPTPPTADSKLGAMVAAMIRFFDAAPAGAVAEGLELLPGVAALLAALSAREDVLVGLVTGNLAPVAEAKVASLGVGAHFTPSSEAGGGGGGPLGGFGSDHCSGNYLEPWHDRAELIRLAGKRAAAAASAAGGGRVVGRVVHLGDTPYDCAAAVAAGARAVGVCTGVHTRAELLAVEGGVVVVLDDLSDTAAAMVALGLE